MEVASLYSVSWTPLHNITPIVRLLTLSRASVTNRPFLFRQETSMEPKINLFFTDSPFQALLCVNFRNFAAYYS